MPETRMNKGIATWGEVLDTVPHIHIPLSLSLYLSPQSNIRGGHVPGGGAFFEIVNGKK